MRLIFLPRNQPDLKAQAKRGSRRIFSRGLGGDQDFLISELRRRGSLGDKRQLEVADDAVHHGIVCQESNDLHLSAASGADQGVHLIDLADHFGPAFRGGGSELLFDNPERKGGQTGLLDFPPVGVSVDGLGFWSRRLGTNTGFKRGTGVDKAGKRVG